MLLTRVVRNTGSAAIGVAEGAGMFFRHVNFMGTLVWKTLTRSHLLLRNVKLTIEQMYVIGIESLALVTVTSVFVGGESVIQAVYQFSGYVPLKYLGLAVCKALTTELCPVITSVVVSGRVATAIAAEIGSMKTSEQLDAMTCLSLDPVRYLIVPKVVAGIVMLPVLVIFSELIAFVGSAVTAVLFVDVTMYAYVTGMKLFFSGKDVFIGVAKTAVFGAAITLTGAHFGFQCLKGARGIGEATTKAVMTAAVLILIFDFLIAFLLL